MRKEALISSCGRYRYTLSRSWSRSRQFATFLMLNPSTADADVDDPTIRKCMGFAERWGCGGIWVVNLFAHRAKDPRELLTVDDPVGPENDEWVLAGISFSNVVCAWGSTGGAAVARLVRERVATLFAKAKAEDVEWTPECLGTAKDGSPRHPLMLPYATRLEPFRGAK